MKENPTDLFKPIGKDGEYHPTFKAIIGHSKGHQAAMSIMNIIYNSFKQIDKDFVKQFQSTNCDARIWELYLMTAFDELGFDLQRKHDRPDFELKKNDLTIFVEAVTSNPAKDDIPIDKLQILREVNDDDWNGFVTNLRAKSLLRLSGALFTKLNKEYWKLDWVKDKPFVLALAPFHHSLAQWLSDSILTSYLYGFETTWHYDENGKLKIKTHRLKEHSRPKGQEPIPSNFFGLENSENISAVLFSNSATISKFTRMGTIQGLGHPDVIIKRFGSMINHDPNAIDGLPFSYTVGNEDPPETWREGLIMYHNPNAKHPIDAKLFPDIGHAYFKEEYTSLLPAFHPIHSQTQIIIKVKGSSVLHRIRKILKRLLIKALRSVR